jgi:hypothetical protein
MLRHPLRLVAASLAALLLVACGASGGPVERPIAATIAAQDSTSPSPRLSDRTIQAGETLHYRVDVPTARDLLYGEAVGSGLRVTWSTTGGGVLAVSNSPTYFAGSVGALAASGSDGDVLEPQSVDVAYTCRGPCAAIAPSASSYILSVHNTTGSSRTFDLYAYTFAANDSNDRGSASNQTASTATTFSGTDSLSGAIELVGDRDWFAYTGSTTRQIEFSPVDPSLGLRLRFADGAEITGGTAPLLPGDRFEVYSVLGRAGPSGTSSYFIEITEGSSAPPIAGTHTAQDTTNPTPLRSTVSIPAGATLYYQIGSGAARDLLYGEAVGGTGLLVSWLRADFSPLAVSGTPAYFSGSAQASADTAALDPASIDVQYLCDGPCVAIAPTASTYYLSVRNTTGSSRTFDLYAYTFAANDLNDRGSASNQTAATAVTFPGAGTLSGAIELIGDRDWFAYTGSGSRVLEFSPLDASLGLRLRFEDGFELTGAAGSQTTELREGDRFQVYSVLGRAGPSGTSGYFIEIRN